MFPIIFSFSPNKDAEPDVWRPDGGAGLQVRAGRTYPQPGEARGGAEGRIQEPDAAPIQHPVHAELLHPPPAQGERGEDRDCWCGWKRQVERGRGSWWRTQCFLRCSWVIYLLLMQLNWSSWEFFLTVDKEELITKWRLYRSMENCIKNRL